MKKIYLLSFIFIFINAYSYATTVTAVKNGAWENGSTWSITNWTLLDLGKDTVVIPNGITVTINSNIDLSLLTIVLQDNGNLNFVGGGSKLILSPASMVQVGYGGIITSTGSPSQVLKIGGNTVYSGSQPNIVGLAYATSTTSGFVSSSVLAVRFTGFTAARKGNAVRLQWTTAEESGTSRFEVERSTDGVKWITAGKINAGGNSTAPLSYSYTDQNNTAQVSYYRIKEVDTNGQYSFTNVISVNGGTAVASAVKIASAGNGSVLLQFSGSVSGKYILRIISMSGQVVGQQELSNVSGNLVLPVSLKGSYVISVSNGQNLQMAKQVIL